MRAVRFHEHGDPDVLALEEVATPDPGPGEVRIDTAAVGVNPVDTYFRTGEYAVPERPWIPGSDVAGVIDAVGPGVTDWTVGDRVFATGPLGNERPGTYAEAVTVPAGWVGRLPEGCAFIEGAALGLVGLTAWRALVEFAGVEPAERVLIHGAAGGVGHVAVQLANAMGARVIATARPVDHEYLLSVGARDAIDYRDDEAALREAVLDLGRPAVILDTHFDSYLQFDADVAATGARVICVGNDGPRAALERAGVAKRNDVRYQFMTMYNAPDVGGVLDRLARLISDGRVVPEVTATYPLAEAATAHRQVGQQGGRGKIVLTV